MPVFLDRDKGTYHLGIWKIEESVDELLTLLPSDKGYSEKIKGIGSESRKKEWLAVRVLLHDFLSDSDEIVYDEDGKPRLKGGKLAVSISHTGVYAALLISRNDAPVGIDIERYRARVSGVLHKFLSDEERKVIAADDVRTQIFYWSAKECIYKCLDKKLVDFRNEIYIPPFTPCEKGETEVFSCTGGAKRRYKLCYEYFEEFLLTMIVC